MTSKVSTSYNLTHPLRNWDRLVNVTYHPRQLVHLYLSSHDSPTLSLPLFSVKVSLLLPFLRFRHHLFGVGPVDGQNIYFKITLCCPGK